MRYFQPHLHQLGLSDPLPSPSLAWGDNTPAPGLLAIGGGLSVQRLLQAYGQGCFPWYSEGQPVMWWSPDPRMVLPVSQFRWHRSLRQHIKSLLKSNGAEIRIDSAFTQVIHACATAPRPGQDGTWIVPDMVRAYEAMHRAGHAHSVETGVDGQLVGGLYCVAIGHAVFGESMFAGQSNASKMALAALTGLCRAQGVTLIDCQQNTAHLASMGALPITRTAFLQHLQGATAKPNLDWKFDPLYWRQLSE